MLSIRPYQRCTNSAVNRRMKPARQTSSTLCSIERRLQHRLEAGAVLAERLALDHLRRNAARGGLFEAAGVGLVRDHDDDLGREIRRLRGLDQRGHVRAAPGDQDGDAALHGRHGVEIEVTVIDDALARLRPR